jgi:membrane protein DedA with SNARE-associated domain
MVSSVAGFTEWMRVELAIVALPLSAWMSVSLFEILCYFVCCMLPDINYYVAHYGYAGIFSLLVLGIVGLPIPDETLLTIVGYMIHQKHLAAVPAYASAVFGSMCGITISYILGRRIGLLILHHLQFFHVTPKQIARVHAWFDRYGTWTLLIGYFVPGVRHLTAVVAGTSDLSYRHFAIFAYSGALLWSATFIGIGYYFGDRAEQVLKQIQHHLIISASIVLVVAVVGLIWIVRKNRNKAQ